MTPPTDDLPTPLPEHLAERATWLSHGDAGEIVVCWLHHAARVLENPALEVAITIARFHDLPLVVHAGFGGRHPHNNDRQLRFMLEGWREVQRELAGRGIRMSVTPPPAVGGTSGLSELASRCRCLVTEDWPRAPYPAWTAAMIQRVPGDLVVVDSACLVPIRGVRGVHDRAFKFRRAVESGWAERIDRPWPPCTETPRAPEVGDFPASTLDLANVDLDDLLANWDIDHAVGPVPGVQGGSSEAVRRWESFLESGIDGYAKRRNDALTDGTSGLSPWIHHGMISPFRIARDAHRRGGAGPEKFLDELLVWRELSFHFCLNRRDHESLSALPNWAIRTLEEHRHDDRSVRSWERLSRGRTGDRLWDAAQETLRRHGWLHNNLRMTWGKAIAPWCADPETALATLIDLNDRYALDGHDPNSIGGLLWCLGLFDRPFPEEQAVTGSLRSRSTKEHARRLSAPRLLEHVNRDRRCDVLVIGGGACGSMAARTLVDHGYDVHVLDKGRGPGGRMSTRRREDVSFDHGCQVLRLRGEHRRELYRSWIQDGLVERWNPRVRSRTGSIAEPDVEWYVGMPGMNAVVRHLQTDLRMHFDATVAEVRRTGDGWSALDASGGTLGHGSRVILAIPPHQAARLLEPIEPGIGERLASVLIDPTWTLMTSGAGADPGFDVAIDPSPDLAWIASEDSRPGRPRSGAWTVHASPAWTREHLELDREDAESLLRRLVQDALDLKLPRGIAHRWRYALTTRPLGRSHLTVGEGGVVVAGDWCLGGRVEHAIESGVAAAGAIMRDPSTAMPNHAGRTLFEATS